MEIFAVWKTIMTGMMLLHFKVNKRLSCTAPDVLLNIWTGNIGRWRVAAGFEVWLFDGAGQVCWNQQCQWLEFHRLPNQERDVRSFFVAYAEKCAGLGSGKDREFAHSPDRLSVSRASEAHPASMPGQLELLHDHHRVRRRRRTG
ncbi:MAG: hypothetical protein OSB41_07570 [Kiritimatiellae bacterium]|nr:hypothetical protein [Kiritimatiellia bacterium]